jgi:hypothetical protein
MKFSRVAACLRAGALFVLLRLKSEAHNDTGLVKTFRELYCTQHNIPQERFDGELVRRSLHLHAWPFYWLFGLNRNYTSPDYEFVRGVGELRNRREFRNEAAEFHYHPHNRGVLRSLLRIRVSSKRLQKIFESEIEEHGSRPPM